MKKKRDNWHDELKDVPLEKLVFLDETAARTSMTRMYGRAPRGQRVVDKVPHGHWKTCSLLSAVRLTGPFAAVTLDGAFTADAFGIYVAEVLAPKLHSGDVVIMDNLAAHKAAGVQEAIEAVGAKVLYLPPYSPDFNPIENMWSKVKCELRRLAARTVDALYAAVDAALDLVTPEDCSGFFRHCGYHAT